MLLGFGPFVLDLETRQLMKSGREMHLSPKAFDLLAMLTTERPKVVSKAALLDRLWPKTFVVEANISNLVAEIRAALGDDPRRPMFVRTARGTGYAFSAEATARSRVDAATARPVCWLVWGQRRFPLAAGEHVIGRDPDVDVRLDATTVSRRHARLLVAEDYVVIEDFGSKNGTFRGGIRVTSPVPLADGDHIRLGSLLVTFHLRGHGSTETALPPTS